MLKVIIKNHLKKIGVLDYSDKKAIMKKIREFESSVLDLDYERNISICKDGSVWVTEGDSANVFPGLIETMTEGTTLKGSYSYHNHPKNETYFSFSADDVAFLFLTESTLQWLLTICMNTLCNGLTIQ